MPSPVPKPSDRRQGRGTAALSVHSGGSMSPDAPPGVLKATREWWDGLWAEPLAGAYERSDVPALRRLATLYDERERSYRAVKKQGRLVTGSQGQPVLSPLLRLVAQLDAEIRQLEDRFGLSPMARLRLGVQFGEAQKSLEALNAEFQDDGDEDDPRIAAADAGPAGVRVDREELRAG